MFENKYDTDMVMSIEKMIYHEITIQDVSSNDQMMTTGKMLKEAVFAGLIEKKRFDEHRDFQFPNSTVEFSKCTLSENDFNSMLILHLESLRSSVRAWKEKWSQLGCNPGETFHEICQPFLPSDSVEDWAIVVACGLPKDKLELKSKLKTILGETLIIPEFTDVFGQSFF